MTIQVVALDQPSTPPHDMPDRFRHDVAYFMSVPGEGDTPAVPEGEYWIRQENARRWMEEGVLEIVSPLDSASKAEIELTDEQEAWLQWMIDHQIQHIRLDGVR